MSDWWGWSWLLTMVGVTALLIAGSKRSIGWAIGLFVSQPLWVIYALATRQYGFLVSVLFYGGTYGRNWWTWRRDERAAGLDV